MGDWGGEWEMEQRERLRGVCPVRLLPLHNLWAAGADHHGSMPRAAPWAVWDRPVNWMLCSCWARRPPFFMPLSLRNISAKDRASYLWATGTKQTGPSVSGSLSCHSSHPLSSLLPYFNRHPATPPRTPAYTQHASLLSFPPSTAFITDSSASLQLSHMHSVEARQSPSISLISW